jgi:hypothetical protein
MQRFSRVEDECLALTVGVFCFAKLQWVESEPPTVLFFDWMQEDVEKSLREGGEVLYQAADERS